MRDERFTSHGIAILWVQSLIDFIEEIEGCWVTFLYGEYQRQCHQRFLAAGQLLHIAHFVCSAVERHFDAHAGEVIDGHLLAGALRGHLFAIVVLAETETMSSSSPRQQCGTNLVVAFFDHQVSCAFGYETFEHLGEVQGDLFECELNGLEAFVVQTFDEVDDVLEGIDAEDRNESSLCQRTYAMRLVDLGFAIGQFIAFVAELQELIQGFLIHMGVLLQFDHCTIEIALKLADERRSLEIDARTQ